jgi:hypothetical protein
MPNIFQQKVVPNKPKVLAQERIYVYMPKSATGKAGLASFNPRDFKVLDGYVSSRWPVEMLVEDLADPTLRPSLSKVLSDEFIKTTDPVTLVNPVTGVSYASSTAEIKLNRIARDATIRPDLVMLETEDFEATETGEGYNNYSLKRNNPLITPSLIQVDNEDFVREDDIVKVNWGFAHDKLTGSNNGYGAVRVADDSAGNLNFSAEDNLQVDIDALKISLGSYDSEGNLIVNVTKEDVGLGNVDNVAFTDRIYTDFGTDMKTHFNTEFGLKLDQADYDTLFSDWAPDALEKNTVQKYFTFLEGEDASIRDSISAGQIFLGFYADEAALIAAHPATALLEGSYAILASTDTNWSVRFNVVWEWYDTTTSSIGFSDLAETVAANVVANGASASVGNTGKWAQSNHVHPYDTTKLDTDTELLLTTEAPNANDFTALLSAGTINIPFVRTAQYLHNWKDNPTIFTQDADSNEYYWAGTEAEFAALDLGDIPEGAILHVEDEGIVEAAGTLATQEQLNVSGLQVTDAYTASTERFIIVDQAVDLTGVPVSVVSEVAAGDLGERRRLIPFDFGAVQQIPGLHRMAIVQSSANGDTLTQRSFVPSRAIISDTSGNLEVSAVHADNLIVTSAASTAIDLTPNRLLRSIGTRTVEAFEAGVIANKPITAKGDGDIKVLSLAGNRVVFTDTDGGLTNSAHATENVLLTGSTDTVVTLATDKLIVSGANNVMSTWDSGGVAGTMIVRGASDGQIAIRTHAATNRILVTGADGTVAELGAGTTGQYLVSTGSTIPGWADGPSTFTNLPQTRYTTNPEAVVANALDGLAAVVLDAAPLVTELRNNCIYYY